MWESLGAGDSDGLIAPTRRARVSVGGGGGVVAGRGRGRGPSRFAGLGMDMCRVANLGPPYCFLSLQVFAVCKPFCVIRDFRHRKFTVGGARSTAPAAPPPPPASHSPSSGIPVVCHRTGSLDVSSVELVAYRLIG